MSEGAKSAKAKGKATHIATVVRADGTKEVYVRDISSREADEAFAAIKRDLEAKEEEDGR